MKIINISHVSFPGEHDPEAWINKSSFFKGIWEAVAQKEQVIFIDFINYNGSLERKGLEYRFLKRSRKALRLPWRIHRMIAREAPDVVIVHGMQFPLQLLSLSFFLENKCKLVVQDHGGQPSQHPLKKWLQRWSARYIDAYFFTATAQAEIYKQERIIKDRQKVKEVMEVSSVFGPEPREQALAVTGIAAGSNYLWIGHLNANKDPLLVLKAFGRMVNQGKEAHLYMIFQTDTLLPEMQAWMAANPEVARCIHLVGKVLHADLQHWFCSVDFIISSSHYEAGGVSVCEGMSCGCIPILSNIPSFVAMTGAACGLLYEGGNEAALADALWASSNMNVPAERQKTLTRFREHLSFEAIAGHIREVLQEL